MRIQILELPYNPDEPERPYAVILSEMPGNFNAEDAARGLKDGGADWVFCTTDRVDVGAEFTEAAKWITPAQTFDANEWVQRYGVVNGG